MIGLSAAMENSETCGWLAAGGFVDAAWPIHASKI